MSTVSGNVMSHTYLGICIRVGRRMAARVLVSVVFLLAGKEEGDAAHFAYKGYAAVHKKLNSCAFKASATLRATFSRKRGAEGLAPGRA